MKRIDLNCDMGESFGAWRLGRDAEVIAFITSANIACGFHAGDPLVMDRTVAMAAARGVGVGAHPGYPDLRGFGRRNMDCTPEEVAADIIYQIGAIQAFCATRKVGLQHVKPHGALYNMAVGNEPLFRAIARAVAAVNPALRLVTLAGNHAPMMARIGSEEGVRVVFEAFPDRAYTPEGKLVSRRLPGAVITDAALATQRAVRMATEGRIVATDGTILEMAIDTLCVHGDTPTALALVEQIRAGLEGAGVALMPMGAETAP
jgi:UPF0271 protein